MLYRPAAMVGWNRDCSVGRDGTGMSQVHGNVSGVTDIFLLRERLLSRVKPQHEMFLSGNLKSWQNRVPEPSMACLS